MAFLVGVLSHVGPATPTRCVQQLSSAVEHRAKSEEAELSCGRIALPPPGGGDRRSKARDDTYDVFMMKGLPPPGPLLIHTLLDCR
jgi:hypothetical protein